MIAPVIPLAAARRSLSPDTVLANARIVHPDGLFYGSLAIRDGRIVDFDSGPSRLPGAVDCDGELLLPGLVELHTDALERHLSPRPGVRWPAEAAVVAHDAQLAAAGITTVLDALAIGDIHECSERVATLGTAVAAIEAAQRTDMLRVDHKLHLRCELSYAGLVPVLQGLIRSPLVRLVSLMDHTPGQRQFVQLERYREYHMAKYGLNDAQMDQFIRLRQAEQQRWCGPNRARAVALAQARDVSLASHDDATEAHVEEAHALGVAIAEFPTTLEAARAARRRGIRVLGGAPNVVRGKSHSGNVAVHDLARAGLLGVLSSDYVPMSLLQAAFVLAEADLGLDLPRAVALVSAEPAAAVGLTDRGRIEIGQRADLIRVARVNGLPLVRSGWRYGQRIV